MVAKVCEPSTVVIDRGLIDNDTTNAPHEVNMHRHILLPGYIEAHVHLNRPENLEQMPHITTAVNLGMWPLSLLTSLRYKLGVTDICSFGVLATSPGTTQGLVFWPALILTERPVYLLRSYTARACNEKVKLLVDAELSTVDALRAAMSLPAKYFGLHDRGVIASGCQAALMLLTADPTEDSKTVT